MSTSDIEGDLRALLVAVAEEAPAIRLRVPRDLSRPRIRTASFPWRWTAPVVAVGCVAMALAAALSLGAHDNRGRHLSGPGSVSPSPLDTVSQTQELMGTWTPVELRGRPVGDNFENPPTVQFAPDGNVNSSDGCNRFHGTFHLGPDPGQISIGPASVRGVVCVRGVPVRHPLDSAKHFQATPGTLKLFDKANHLIATYRRDEPAVHRHR